MSFAWPWFCCLLPMLWIIKSSPTSLTDGAINHPYLSTLATLQRKNKTLQSRSPFIVLSWLCLVLALMRPQFIGEPVSNTVNGRSIFLSVDLSESMLTDDMQWNGQRTYRYRAVQEVVGEFVQHRQGDFFGLVVFGSFASVQSPLTADTQAVHKLLFDLIPGMAGKSTAIGDGLAQSVKQLRDSKSDDKIIILLSDGENNAGAVEPLDAIVAAQKTGIRVYTIGFGGDAQNQSLFSLMSSSGVDEQTLKQIAQQTGGQYFRTRSANQLQQVFEQINQLESSEKDTDKLRLINELYWLPLSFCFLFISIPIVAYQLKERQI